MPDYAYHCPVCPLTFELNRPMSAVTPTAECPDCGAVSDRSYVGMRFAAHGGPTTGGGTGKRAAAGRQIQKKNA